MKLTRVVTYVLASLATPTLLQAHTGHGTIPAENGLAHNLFEPLHIGVAILAFLAIISVFRFMGHTRKK